VLHRLSSGSPWFGPNRMVHGRWAMKISAIYFVASPHVNWQVMHSDWMAGTAGDYMRVSGWGTTRYGNSNSSNQLRTVRIQLIQKTTCQRAYQNRDTLSASAFCARSNGRDSCTGDSGGGAIFNNQLCGIVSWGLGCADSKYPGVYTSVHRTRSFIVNAMKK